MAKVKTFAMDMEEDFYGGAQDIVHECSTLMEFLEVMFQYRDQVQHQTDWQVAETLAEIYYG